MADAKAGIRIGVQSDEESAIRRLRDEIAALRREVRLLKKESAEQTDEFAKGMQTAQQSAGGLINSIKAMGPAIAAAFSIGPVVQFFEELDKRKREAAQSFFDIGVRRDQVLTQTGDITTRATAERVRNELQRIDDTNSGVNGQQVNESYLRVRTRLSGGAPDQALQVVEGVAKLLGNASDQQRELVEQYTALKLQIDPKSDINKTISEGINLTTGIPSGRLGEADQGFVRSVQAAREFGKTPADQARIFSITSAAFSALQRSNQGADEADSFLEPLFLSMRERNADGGFLMPKLRKILTEEGFEPAVRGLVSGRVPRNEIEGAMSVTQMLRLKAVSPATFDQAQQLLDNPVGNAGRDITTTAYLDALNEQERLKNLQGRRSGFNEANRIAAQAQFEFYNPGFAAAQRSVPFIGGQTGDALAEQLGINALARTLSNPANGGGGFQEMGVPQGGGGLTRVSGPAEAALAEQNRLLQEIARNTANRAGNNVQVTVSGGANSRGVDVIND